MFGALIQMLKKVFSRRGDGHGGQDVEMGHHGGIQEAAQDHGRKYYPQVDPWPQGQEFLRHNLLACPYLTWNRHHYRPWPQYRRAPEHLGQPLCHDP